MFGNLSFALPCLLINLVHHAPPHPFGDGHGDGDENHCKNKKNFLENFQKSIRRKIFFSKLEIF
jgi:hypothetical protein